MAGVKRWAVGEVLKAQDLNNYVADQTVIICTTASRPSGLAVGQLISCTDTDCIQRHVGSNNFKHVSAHSGVVTYLPDRQRRFFSFPHSFDQVPIVQVTAQAYTNNTPVDINLAGVDKTGFWLFGAKGDDGGALTGSGVAVYWTATD